MEIKQLKQEEVVTDVLCDVCNQLTRNWSLELYQRIGGMAPRMMGKDMSCSYVRNVSFIP